MYIGHGRLCVSPSPHSHTTAVHAPGCNLGGMVWGPVVMHYWADLQSVHGFRYYDNIVPNVKCQRVLVLPLCLVDLSAAFDTVDHDMLLQ